MRSAVGAPRPAFRFGFERLGIPRLAAGERIAPAVLAAWAIAAVVATLTALPALARMDFPDPDDVMRLMEARDWLAGQSWWDVSQHRLNGGHFLMHWSRLVDLPLAAAMLGGNAVFGAGAGDRVALIVVPLTTLLAAMAIAAALARELAGAAAARLAAPLLPFSAPVLFQMRPMRIDHHGWQIVLALLTVLFLIGGRPSPRRGAAAGLALALLVTVSLEGLPITAAVTGVAALAWAGAPVRWRGFALALVWTLFGAALMLHVVTRGPGMFAGACDAISPAWLAMFGVAAVGLTTATAFGRSALPVRLAALGMAGAAAAATLAGLAPTCLQGPFATLDPLVYQLWFRNVAEGLPIWDQSGAVAGISLAAPIVGLFGGWLAWRRSEGEARERWTLFLVIAGAAFALSVLVLRANGTANALAVPGQAVVLAAAMRRARAVRTAALRVFATVGAFLIAAPALALGMGLTLENRIAPEKPTPRASATPVRPACEGFEDMTALAELPPATVFAPVDPSPVLVALTRHHAIAGGYHRNAAAIRRVFLGFLSSPDRAERIVRSTGAQYVAGCPGMPETELYRAHAPNGVWARLYRGERVAWLRPITLSNTHVLAWRVVDARPVPGPPTRF